MEQAVRVHHRHARRRPILTRPAPHASVLARHTRTLSAANCRTRSARRTSSPPHHWNLEGTPQGRDVHGAGCQTRDHPSVPWGPTARRRRRRTRAWSPGQLDQPACVPQNDAFGPEARQQPFFSTLHSTDGPIDMSLGTTSSKDQAWRTPADPAEGVPRRPRQPGGRPRRTSGRPISVPPPLRVRPATSPGTKGVASRSTRRKETPIPGEHPGGRRRQVPQHPGLDGSSVVRSDRARCYRRGCRRRDLLSHPDTVKGRASSPPRRIVTEVPCT